MRQQTERERVRVGERERERRRRCVGRIEYLGKREQRRLCVWERTSGKERGGAIDGE